MLCYVLCDVVLSFGACRRCVLCVVLRWHYMPCYIVLYCVLLCCAQVIVCDVGYDRDALGFAL